ncbi:hypothetical protein Tco_0005104 [Tanacetum coccineum]
MSKNDMKNRIYTLSKNDLKDLVKTYRIPLDLHPRLPDPRFTMDHLSDGAIGIYSEFLWFSGGIRILFSTFLLSVLKYFKVHISQLVPLGLNKVVSFELVYRDLNIVPTVTLFQCDPVFRRIDDNAEMSIYDFMTLPSWGDAKVAKESHHLSSPLLERVPSHTTASAAEGAMIPLPTLDEIAASMPDPRLAKKSKGSSQVSVRSSSDTVLEPGRPSKKRKLRKRSSEAGSSTLELGQAEGVDEADLTDFCAEIENSLERDEGTYIRATSVPTPRLGKRLGAPPSVVVVSASGSSLVGTSVHAFYFRAIVILLGRVAEVVRRQMDPLDSLAHSALARDAEYDQILKYNFGTTTRGEEIDLTLFSLTPSPYQMSYPYEALDWTITPTKLKRTESLLPLDLSNCFNVLSALLVSYGADRISRCTGLLQLESLRELIGRLGEGIADALLMLGCPIGVYQRSCPQTDAKLSDQTLVVRDLQNELVLEKAKSQGYKDDVDGLREEVTRFVGFGVESLVRKLLSSDEFHAALAHVASLDINYGVKRGLRMRRTDAEFEAVAQKVFG